MTPPVILVAIMTLMDPHREFVYEKAPFPSCHASTLIECADGDILAAWFGGSDEGERDVAIWMARRKGSEESGEWSAPAEAARHRSVPCWNPVLFRDRGGKVWLFYKAGTSPETWSGFHRTSTDDGKTFGEAAILPAGLLGPIKNKPIELADGSILCGTSVESYQAWSCWTERSEDGGRSWTRHGPITVTGHPHGIIQPTLFPGDEPGEVRMLVRARGLGKIHASMSKDLGRTWSPAEPVDLPHPNAGIDAVRLRDGRVALLYNHTPRGRTPLNVAVSKDLGKSWTPALVLEDEPGEYSYPAVIQLRDGDLAATYTWRRQRIRFVRIPLADLGR